MSSPVGVPDLLSHLRMGKSQQAARQAFDRASLELATGEKSDRFAASGGDTTKLDAIERSISRIDTRQPLLALAGGRAGAAQNALGAVAEAVDTIGVDLMNTVETIRSGSLDIVIGEADAALRQTISALNTSFGGRFLFSGGDVDKPPFPDQMGQPFADALIDAIQTAVANEAPTDADGVQSAIDDFFAGTDWADMINGEGAGSKSAPVELRDGVRIDYAVKADAEPIIALIRNLATVVAAGDLELPEAEKQNLYRDSGEALIGAVSRLADMRGRLGVSESAIEKAQAADAAERSALEQARAKIVARDPYDAATEVAQLETQLQSIYAMTARSAQLSLVNFLR
ncbi:MAG: flagellin [Rubrimonas sp.]|uniref:flagellin n=1 Tax=Rubrimonas sp. TaxID=2036015 RepID=UPI002FDD1DB1